MEYLRGASESPFFSNDLNAVKVRDGQLLLLWDGSNAGEFMLGKEGYLSSTMVKIEIEELNKIYSKYLCFAFEQLLRDLTIGMGIPHVNGDMLGNIRINIPSKDEQKHIADFLDKKTKDINNLLERDKQLIELLKERRVALINHIITKGLTPKTKFKDSGVNWIGDIPEEEMGICLYETTTEGTPLTPIFPDTPEGQKDLAAYASEYATAYADWELSTQQWEARLFGEQEAPVSN